MKIDSYLRACLRRGRESLGQETLWFDGHLTPQRGLRRTQSRLQMRNSPTRNGLEIFTKSGPGRAVASQPQNALNAHCTCPILLTGHVPDRSKPQRERQSRPMENGPCGDRHLTSATSAQPQPVLHGPSFLMATTGANETVGPPQQLQIHPAGVIRRESTFQFQNRSRIVFHPHILHVVYG